MEEICKCGCPKSHHWPEGDNLRVDFCKSYQTNGKWVYKSCVDDVHDFEEALESYINLIREEG